MTRFGRCGHCGGAVAVTLVWSGGSHRDARGRQYEAECIACGRSDALPESLASLGMVPMRAYYAQIIGTGRTRSDPTADDEGELCYALRHPWIESNVRRDTRGMLYCQPCRRYRRERRIVDDAALLQEEVNA